MTATMTSQLNPFADAFIPSSLSNSCRLESQMVLQSTYKMKAMLHVSSVKSSDYKTPEMDLNDIKDFSILKTSSWNARFDVSGFMIAESVNESEVSITQNLSHFSADHEKKDQKDSVDFESMLHDQEPEDECRCPPMFGCVIPVNFLGNPFYTKYACNKKYAHIPRLTNNEQDKLDDTELKMLTLEQCIEKYKNLLRDVYETVLKSAPTLTWDGKDKIKDYLNKSDSEMDDSRSTSKNAKSELVDDGCHPLLQEAVITNANEDTIEIESIEKILEASLMQSTDQSFNCEAVNADAVCNPPCSVWCDFLPSAAKDTFKQYVRKYGLITEAKVAGRGSVSVGSKPVYKRSFSADDASSYAQQSRCFQTSTAESKEMLLELRKDPVAYFKKNACNAINGGAKQYRSCSDLGYQSHAKSNVVDSNILWGPFDGADSLWQPLPDCVPTNEANPKQNGYKRGGREMRRQRSVN